MFILLTIKPLFSTIGVVQRKKRGLLENYMHVLR